jgi:inosine/xanthosine triphosphatase
MAGKIHIAVGSTRKPKLDAVREALADFGERLDTGAGIEIVGIAVPSTVRHTPLSREETMAGAKSRVLALKQLADEQAEPWRFLVGLEGGLDVIAENGARRVFLENWVYVADRAGRAAWGRSGGILLPETLAAEVVDRGVELGEAIDAFAGERGIRDAQGAWGVLSRNLITRQEAFRIAVIGAFAPFYNGEIYRRR